MFLPMFCAVFIFVIVMLSAYGMQSWLVPAYYAFLGACAFIAYAVDKSAAAGGRRRIRERTLHLLSLAGGWPGALLAQGLLRHKTRKPSFQAWYLASTALNCLAFAGLAYACIHDF